MHEFIVLKNVNINEVISYIVETNMEKQILKIISIGIIFLVLSLFVAVTRSPWLLRWLIPDPLRQYVFTAVFAVIGVVLILIGMKRKQISE